MLMVCEKLDAANGDAAIAVAPSATAAAAVIDAINDQDVQVNNI